MSLLVLAFPNIEIKDFNWIQSYRKANDELYYNIVDPHFTLVFPVSDKTEDEFIKEIEIQSKETKIINFELEKVILNKDAFKEYFHEFLIPTIGQSEITNLHDKLYSGSLLPNLRSDIEYIPHIGIGNSKDLKKCQSAIDNLNLKGLSIKGRIEAITIVRYSHDTIYKLRELKLK